MSVSLLTEGRYMAFGEELQRLREAAGLSQAELAGRAGLSLRSVQNWEQGHRKPKADALLALSGPLQVPVETLVALVAGQPAPPPSPKGGGKGKRRGKRP